MLFVFSVGGGSLEKNISPNLVRALQYAQAGRRADRRRRRPRRRLHGAGRRRLRDRADRESRQRSRRTPRRSRRWSGTCSCRIPRSRRRRRSGNRPRSTPRRLPRPRRRDQPRDRSRRQAVSAGVASRSSRSCRACAAALARLKAAGLSARRRHQPAGRRARHADARASSKPSTRGWPSTLPIDEFRVCYHDDARRVRVPEAEAGPAARRGARARHRLPRSVMVGDRWRDIEAGQRRRLRARCSSTTATTSGSPSEPTRVVGSLAEAADWILDRHGATTHEACRRAVGEDLRRRRRPAGHARAVPQAVHQGLHDQPDADAQGRHHRLPRVRAARCSPRFPTGRSRSRCSRTSSPRWSARRARSRAGARTST